MPIFGKTGKLGEAMGRNLQKHLIDKSRPVNRQYLHTTSNLFSHVSKKPLHSAWSSVRASMLSNQHLEY